jgi:hypothetical protein
MRSNMTYEAKNWSLLLSDQCVIHLLVDEVLDINGLCLAFFPTHEHLMVISKEVDKTCMNSIQLPALGAMFSWKRQSKML